MDTSDPLASRLGIQAAVIQSVSAPFAAVPKTSSAPSLTQWGSALRDTLTTLCSLNAAAHSLAPQPLSLPTLPPPLPSVSTKKRQVQFFPGYTEILRRSLTVSSYVLRAHTYFPKFLISFLAIVDVPNATERLLQYFASRFFRLFILNVAPVICLNDEASHRYSLTLKLIHANDCSSIRIQ